MNCSLGRTVVPAMGDVTECSESVSSEGVWTTDPGGWMRFWCFVRVVLRQKL
jgi:hypothetical protein